jgi:hypothetical protein
MLTPEQAKAMLPYMQAIAEGKIVQVKWFNGQFYDYTEYSPGYPDKDAEWRIKPDPVTIKYRVALFYDTETGEAWTDVPCYEDGANDAEKSVYFQRWLTDLIEVEV